MSIYMLFLLRRTMKGAAVKGKAVIIKKYENRRLYDSSTSQYVTLEDIANMIRNGKEVRVVDAKTGRDLTRVTFTQIIVEDTKGGPTGLPLELLRQLIVASDRAGREFVMWYLNSAFNAYQKMRESLQSGLNDVRSALLPPLPPMQKSVQGKAADNNTRRKRVSKSAARKKKPANGARSRKSAR